MDPERFFEALAAVPNFRSATFNDLEMTTQGSGFRFRGHAAVFDEEALLDEIPGIGRLTESIQRGAFRKVLQRDDNIPFTLEHDEKRVFATTRSGRLRLSEDAKGLAVDADLPDTSLARDLHALVESDVIRGMSFGFVVGDPRNQKVERRSGGQHRILTGFKKLLDVCATWNPTYRSAEAQFRSLTMQYADSPESLQQILMGAYPQLQAQGDDKPDGTDEEPPPADDTETPDGEPQDDGERDVVGAAEHRSVAARRRALSFYILNTGGVEP